MSSGLSTSCVFLCVARLTAQFGGSSVATAERLMEVADIVCSFPEHLPCVVLSAMGKVRAGPCVGLERACVRRSMRACLWMYAWVHVGA